MITILNQTEILIVEKVEHKLCCEHGDGSLLILMRLAQIITSGLILGANLQIIIFIVNQGSKTFLDWLIIFDCLLCLTDLRIIILILNYSDFVDFCIYHVGLTFFTTLCSKLLSLGIVVYRFTLVLGSSLVFSTNQKKVLENIILFVILSTSLILTGGAVYYKEENRHFLSNKVKLKGQFQQMIYFILVCAGRDHEFFYNSSDFYQIKKIGIPLRGQVWTLSITNPFFFATLFVLFNGIAINPICYAAIYRQKLRMKKHLKSSQFKKRTTGIKFSIKVQEKTRSNCDWSQQCSQRFKKKKKPGHCAV